MPKVVVDTSVFIAGFLSKNKMSNPSTVISMWRDGAFTLVMSPKILTEIVAKMLDKGFTENEAEAFVISVGKVGLLIPGAYETHYLDAIDVNDNMFLAACLESNADYLVSFDHQSLLPMKHFHGTTICTPELFIRFMYGLEEEKLSDQKPNKELAERRNIARNMMRTRRKRESGIPES